jgi:uncharacterized OB-fold protein
VSKAVADRPRPEASELTAPFWQAAREHVLVRPVCNACGKNFFTPQIACPACLSVEWAYEPSSGAGNVYSATVVHRAPFPGLRTPYQVAIVDLDEGWSMLTNLVGADAPTPIGTKVEVAWIDVDAELTLPTFRPVER